MRKNQRSIGCRKFTMNVMAAHTVSEGLVGSHLKQAEGVNSSPKSPPVCFYMPMPPSVNQAYINTKRGRAKSKSYTDWAMVARTQIRLQKVPKVSGYTVVIMGFERDARLKTADVDNRVKLTLDSLKDNGVIDDDRFVTCAPPIWLPPSNGLAHIQIIPIQGGEIIRLAIHVSSDGSTGALIVEPQQNNGDHQWL